MSERRVTSIDFATGQIRRTVTKVPQTESLEQRIADLQAQATEHLPGAEKPLRSLLAVRCDHCERAVELQQPVLPDGWSSDHRGELCPDCT